MYKGGRAYLSYPEKPRVSRRFARFLCLQFYFYSSQDIMARYFYPHFAQSWISDVTFSIVYLYAFLHKLQVFYALILAI